MSPSGAASGRSWWAINAAILLVFSFILTACRSIASVLSPPLTAPVDSDIKIIQVIIVDSKDNHSIDNAVVRVSGTSQIDNNDDGGYYLQSCILGQLISAWAQGYYITTVPCTGSISIEYKVQLKAMQDQDNTDYAWVGAEPHPDSTQNCMVCHSSSSLPHLNEYSEWTKDGHSKVFVDPYFPNTYMGTNVYGYSSQQVQWEILQGGQKIYPILDPEKSSYGPSYRLDYPVSNGNCAFCHVPASHPGTLQEVNVASLIPGPFGSRANVMTEGVGCDVCHKVTDVLVNKDSQMPYDDRPGILSMSLRQPIQGNGNFIFGPLEYQLMIADLKATCYPVFSESRFCASCHYGRFANQVIYNSYGEWLNSPYRDKYLRSASNQIVGENSRYRSCQDCHMLSNEQVLNSKPSEHAACSNTNRQLTDFDHDMMKHGTDNENPNQEIPTLVKNAASVSLEPSKQDGQIKVKITIMNVEAGHKFPTDSPLRHLILLVEARDWRNTLLIQTDGPIVPAWAASDFAGLPGTIFANVLKNKDTDLAPAFDYWNPVEPAWDGADTRLVPLQPVQSEYSFAAPYDGTATISAKLIYRNVFRSIADQKNWTVTDIVVTDKTVQVP